MARDFDRAVDPSVVTLEVRAVIGRALPQIDRHLVFHVEIEVVVRELRDRDRVLAHAQSGDAELAARIRGRLDRCLPVAVGEVGRSRNRGAGDRRLAHEDRPGDRTGVVDRAGEIEGGRRAFGSDRDIDLGDREGHVGGMSANRDRVCARLQIGDRVAAVLAGRGRSVVGEPAGNRDRRAYRGDSVVGDRAADAGERLVHAREVGGLGSTVDADRGAGRVELVDIVVVARDRDRVVGGTQVAEAVGSARVGRRRTVAVIGGERYRDALERAVARDFDRAVDPSVVAGEVGAGVGLTHPEFDRYHVHPVEIEIVVRKRGDHQRIVAHAQAGKPELAAAVRGHLVFRIGTVHEGAHGRDFGSPDRHFADVNRSGDGARAIEGALEGGRDYRVIIDRVDLGGRGEAHVGRVVRDADRVGSGLERREGVASVGVGRHRSRRRDASREAHHHAGCGPLIVHDLSGNSGVRGELAREVDLAGLSETHGDRLGGHRESVPGRVEARNGDRVLALAQTREGVLALAVGRLGVGNGLGTAGDLDRHARKDVPALDRDGSEDRRGPDVGTREVHAGRGACARDGDRLRGGGELDVVLESAQCHSVVPFGDPAQAEVARVVRRGASARRDGRRDARLAHSVNRHGSRNRAGDRGQHCGRRLFSITRGDNESRRKDEVLPVLHRVFPL